MALSQSWNGNWTSPAIRITSYSGNEINILNPSFIFYYYWNILRIHSMLMNFFIQNQKTQFLFAIRIFSIFRCRFSRYMSVCFFYVQLWFELSLVWFPHLYQVSNCIKKKSKSYKDVSNKTKSYHGPTFRLFCLKNLDWFNKHFDISTFSLFQNSFREWISLWKIQSWRIEFPFQ